MATEDSENFESHEVQQPDVKEGYGFFSQISDARHYKRIQDRIEQKGYFTDRVLFDSVHVRMSDLLLLLSPSGVLSHATHVRPAKISTTGTKGIKAGNPVELNITEEELESALPEIWPELRQAFHTPSYRPPLPEWTLLWEAIKGLRPQQADALRKLEQLRFEGAFTFDGDGRGTQAFYEKDAVGVALHIAGIAFNGVFAEVSDGLSADKSLLQSLCGNSSEDVVIAHDVKNFPGYIPAEEVAHAVRLQQGNKAITIYNVNRRRAEAAIGVDLIYRNAKYGSFVFVQYKMLNPEGVGKKWVYRPDSQFDLEAARMRTSRAAFLKRSGGSLSSQYRLGTDPFFFKFCRRQHLKINAGLLAHGHYLTLSHLDLMDGKGAHGGKIITLDSMERWITRTAFATLVANGWVGTSNLTDEMLKAYIEEAVANHKSIIVAEGHETESENDDAVDDEIPDEV